MARLNTAFAASVGVATFLGAAQAAQALDVGTCIAKSDIKAVLGEKEGQHSVYITKQPTFIKGDFAQMPVVFLAGPNGTGYIFKEDGCTPDFKTASNTVANAASTGVRVAMAFRSNVHVFDYLSDTLPEKAYVNDDPQRGLNACMNLVKNRRYKPDLVQDEASDAGQVLNESLQTAGVPIDGCNEHNAFVNPKSVDSSHRLRILFQGQSILKNGANGALVTLLAKPDMSWSGIILTTPDGAAVDGEGYSAINPTKFTNDFIEKKTASLQPTPQIP